MSTNTTNLGMGKAVDGDNAKTYMETTLGAALDTLDGKFTSTGLIALTSVGGGTPAANQIYQENSPKAWGLLTTGGAISGSFNISSITDDGVGLVSVFWDRDFANTNYVATATAQNDTPIVGQLMNSGKAAGSCQFAFFVPNSGAAADPTRYMITAFGTQ